MISIYSYLFRLNGRRWNDRFESGKVLPFGPSWLTAKSQLDQQEPGANYAPTEIQRSTALHHNKWQWVNTNHHHNSGHGSAILDVKTQVSNGFDPQPDGQFTVLWKPKSWFCTNCSSRHSSNLELLILPLLLHSPTLTLLLWYTQWIGVTASHSFVNAVSDVPQQNQRIIWSYLNLRIAGTLLVHMQLGLP